MSAERLRKVAAEMREYAEAATPGPWNEGDIADVKSAQGWTVADVWLEKGNARHIAAWSPPVALAVAEFLDVFTECVADDPGSAEMYFAEMDAAIAVCDAWEAGRP